MLRKTTLAMCLLLGCGTVHNSAQPSEVPEHPAMDEVVTPEKSPEPPQAPTSAIMPPDEPVTLVTETPPVPLKPKVSTETLALAKAIYKFKEKTDRGRWVECGIKYEEPDMRTAALEWATAINKAYKNTEYTLRGKTIKVPKEEVLGVIINESRFDRCAVGPHPRKFAYQKGILSPNRLGPSHTLEELEQVFTHPKFQGRKADLGGAQIVRKIGKNHTSWEEIQDYLSIDPGVQLIFDEMKRRGEMYGTKNPSSRWPGSANHQYYTLRVLRNASLIMTHL